MHARPWDAGTRARHVSRAADCAGCPVQPSGNTNHLPRARVHRTAAHSSTPARKASSLPGQQAFQITLHADREAASTDHALYPLLPPAPATSRWILIILPRTWPARSLRTPLTLSSMDEPSINRHGRVAVLEDDVGSDGGHA